MGCQSSKAASTPKQHQSAEEKQTAQNASTAQHVLKTLLEDAAVAKDTSTAQHVTAQKSPADVPLTAPSHVAMNNSPMPVSETQSDGATMNNTSMPGSGTQSNGTSGFLRKQRTLCTDKKELDIMVVSFSSHDSTVGSLIGRNCKEMRWKVMHDCDADPLDIKLHVQEHKLHSNEVSIECNGRDIYHGVGGHAKAKMIEDFHYKWPFRASIPGLNEEYFFEFRPPCSSSDIWFPATIKSQRDDGLFEVNARELDGNGCFMDMKYPAVHKDSLRVAATQQPLMVPESSLMLHVPKQDPLRATLSMENGELVTHHFGRPSPPLATRHPPLTTKPEVALKVSKDRSLVTANVGHGVLSHFMSGEVRAIKSDMVAPLVGIARHSWTVQVGPFAEHTVEILKKHTLGKVVTLLVDGEILVESSATDMGCQGKEWQCDFRFVGERVLNFEVNKTNSEGTVLDEVGHVKDRHKYVHECTVMVPNDHDLCLARIVIDGMLFTELPTCPQHYEEAHLSMNPQAMLHSYGITTPYKVDKLAPSSMTVFASRALAQADDSRKAAGVLAQQVLVKAQDGLGSARAAGFFGSWCDCSTVVPDEADSGASRSAPTTANESGK